MMSEIECGIFSNRSLSKVYKIQSPHFDADVEIFIATCDPSRTILYRVSDLAKKLGIPANRVAMFVKRNKSKMNGVYQSTAFVDKPPHTHGLRVGSYFLSVEAVEVVQNHFTGNKNSDEQSGYYNTDDVNRSSNSSVSSSFRESQDHTVTNNKEETSMKGIAGNEKSGMDHTNEDYEVASKSSSIYPIKSDYAVSPLSTIEAGQIPSTYLYYPQVNVEQIQQQPVQQSAFSAYVPSQASSSSSSSPVVPMAASQSYQEQSIMPLAGLNTSSPSMYAEYNSYPAGYYSPVPQQATVAASSFHQPQPVYYSEFNVSGVPTQYPWGLQQQHSHEFNPWRSF